MKTQPNDSGGPIRLTLALECNPPHVSHLNIYEKAHPLRLRYPFRRDIDRGSRHDQLRPQAT